MSFFFQSPQITHNFIIVNEVAYRPYKIWLHSTFLTKSPMILNLLQLHQFPSHSPNILSTTLYLGLCTCSSLPLEMLFFQISANNILFTFKYHLPYQKSPSNSFSKYDCPLLLTLPALPLLFTFFYTTQDSDILYDLFVHLFIYLPILDQNCRKTDMFAYFVHCYISSYGNIQCIYYMYMAYMCYIVNIQYKFDELLNSPPLKSEV